MSRLRDFLNRGREEGGEDGFDYDEQTVTLEQVMALCVGVEERAALRTIFPYCINTDLYSKPGFT